MVLVEAEKPYLMSTNVNEAADGNVIISRGLVVYNERQFMTHKWVTLTSY
jgi:hypothetical protein